MSISGEDKQKVKNLVASGQRQGYISHDEILNIFPEVEENLQLLEYIVSSLQDSDIEIIDVAEGDGVALSETTQSKMTFEEKIKILKQIKSHISTDPIRAYLHEIGKIPLLNAEEEVYFAKRIEDAEKEFSKVIKELGSKKIDEVYIKAAKALEKGNKKSVYVDSAKKRISEKDRKFCTKVLKDGIEAKHLLTTANLRLVVSIAKNYVKRGLDLLDLIQEGNLGLMRAVDKFEYRKGFKFSTYATW